MNLNDTLTLLALQLQLDPTELQQYAAEDVLGGYHFNPTEARWPIGSLFAVEGQALYALVRALKPAHVVEIGSLRGCSTAHLATALSVNGAGRLTAVDIEPGSRDLFPKHLESIVTGVLGDGIEWLAGQEDESIDFVFEDSSHGEDQCASIAALCKTKLTPGGVLVMHDAAHTQAILGDGTIVHSDVGAEVCRGLDRALGNEYRVYLSEPSDCGFAVWQRAKETFSDAVYSRLESGQVGKIGTITEKGFIPTVDEKNAAYQAQFNYPIENGIPTQYDPDKDVNIAEYYGFGEKPKREMITEDGERLEIVDAPPVETLPAKKKPGRKPKAQNG